MILDDIVTAIVAGKSPLVLTERAAHVEYFAQKLAGFSKHIIALRWYVLCYQQQVRAFMVGNVSLLHHPTIWQEKSVKKPLIILSNHA